MVRNYLLLALAALSLSACTAPPLPPQSMLPMTDVMQQLTPHKKLENNITLGTVTVPKELATSSIASVTDDLFRDALSSSLLTAGLLKRGNAEADYVLNAEMLKLDLPSFGFEMSTASSVKYSLIKRKTDAVVHEEIINQEFTANLSDAFVAHERARITASNSIRENITHLIRVLNSLSLDGKAAPKP